MHLFNLVYKSGNKVKYLMLQLQKQNIYLFNSMVYLYNLVMQKKQASANRQIPFQQQQQNNLIGEVQQSSFTQQNLIDLQNQAPRAGTFSVFNSQNEPLKDRDNYNKFLQNRQVIIQGPQLISQGYMKSYKLYTIISRKIIKQQQGTQELLVLLNKETKTFRRFNDFQFLQSYLLTEQGGSIIPMLPQKNFWASLNLQGSQFIELRRNNLDKYIHRILQHSKLKELCIVKKFIFLEDQKFSEEKGQYIEKQKTQDKVKQLAKDALTLGKTFFSRIWDSGQKEVQADITIVNPTKEDLTIARYEIQVNDLIRASKTLRGVVEKSTKQIQLVNRISKVLNSKSNNLSALYQQLQKNEIQGEAQDLQEDYKKLGQRNKLENEFCLKILSEFENLSQFIDSCYLALQRRKKVRLQLMYLYNEQDSIAKQVKVNPRSYSIDILRNKLKKTEQIVQKWTRTLLNQLSVSLVQGKTMIEKFINNYSTMKRHFYNQFSWGSEIKCEGRK